MDGEVARDPKLSADCSLKSGIDKATDAAEFKLKIADLSVALSDIKIALADAKEELSSKQSEIDALKKKFARIEDTIEYQGYKYAKGPDGQPKGAPFCPVCEQKEGLTVRIVDFRSEENCPHCNSKYNNLRFFDEWRPLISLPPSPDRLS